MLLGLARGDRRHDVCSRASQATTTTVLPTHAWRKPDWCLCSDELGIRHPCYALAARCMVARIANNSPAILPERRKFGCSEIES